MSSVHMLYFAGVKELLGLAEEDLDLPDDVRTLSRLVGVLVRAHPALDGRLASVRFAINESFAVAEDPVAPGDVIAVIPPVAGG